MRETPRSRRGALAPVWGGLTASFLLLSASPAFAVDTVTGNFASPSGVVFDSGVNERALGVAVDASSNSYVVGYKPSGGGNDWVILKLDPAGVLLSSASFDSGGSSLDEARDVLVAGANLIVVGKAGTLRMMRVYNTADLAFVGAYSDSFSGTFNAVISSGTNLITSSLGGGQLLVNEFTTGAGLVNVATFTFTGSYGEGGANRNLAIDNAQWIYVVGVRDDTKVLRLERLGAVLSAQGSLEFNESDDIVAGAAVAVTPSGDVYSVAVGSGVGQSINHIYRTAGVSSLLAGTTVTASGEVFSSNERVVAVDPTNLDVYYAGSGPFPGIQKFPSDLSAATQKTLFPTSSLSLLNGANIWATEVNQSGAQDFQVHRVDFSALAGAGGEGHGVNEPASDGTYIYLARTDSSSPGMAEIYKMSLPSTMVASATVSGLSSENDVKAVYQGANLYIVGAASGPTTFGVDAAVFKIDPNTLLMVSSRTLDSTGGQGDDVVMGATVTATGNLVLAGALQNGATTYLGALWSYDTGTGVLALLASANAPGSNTDLFESVASTGSGVYWMVGYSSITAGSGRDKMALSLWRYQTGLTHVNDRAGYGDSLDFAARITADANNLYVAAERRNPTDNKDLAFIKYDLAGSPVVENFWHSQSPFRKERVGGIVLDVNGDLVVSGGVEDLVTSTGASAYWKYTAATGLLSTGFPKTFSAYASMYSAIRHGADVYSATFSSSTPILLSGGATITGAETVQGAAAPLAFTFTGSPAAALKINSNNNQNESMFHVYVDTNTGNIYAQWHSTSGSPAQEPDVVSIGKFSAGGTLLSSVTLNGNHAGDGMLLANGFIYVQERDEAYSFFNLVKYDLNLAFVAAKPIDSTQVGNLTNSLTRDGFLYYAADGAGGAGGGHRLLKFDANMVGLATASYTGVGGSVHHNNDALAVDGAGNFYVAVSTGEGSGLDHHIVKYDGSLNQVAVATVTNQFPSVPKLAYGNGTLYVGGSDDLAQKVFLRKFNTSLAYSGQSATITVTGATPNFDLRADSAGNAVVGLTSSTADGGDLLAFKFDANLVQLSSAQFDGGFGSADSGTSIVPDSTGTVVMGGFSFNSSHYDAVLLRRSLPAAAGGGGGPASPALTFSGTFVGADGSKIQSSNGFNVVGHSVIVDTLTAGGPFVYVRFNSTTGAVNAYAGVGGIARYDQSGTLLSSTPLRGGGDGLVQDSAGNIYLSMSTQTVGSWLEAYTKDLVFLGSSTIVNNPSNTSDGQLVYDGTSLFLNTDFLLIRYNTSLVKLATSAAMPGYRAGMALDGAGNVYVAEASTTGGGAHLFRYPTGFGDGASPALQTNVSSSLVNSAQSGNLASAGGSLYVVAPSSDGTKVYLRKFDSSLNYTGVSATFTNTTALLGARVTSGPDGRIYAVTSVSGTVSNDAYLAAAYDQGLAFVSSATFNGISNTGGAAIGIAVKDAASVFLTGTSCNGGNPGDCKAVTVVRSLSGAGGGLVHAKGASESVVSESDDDELAIDAAWVANKLLVAWQHRTVGGPGVRAQMLTAAGVPSGSPLILNSGSPSGWCGESSPNVASDGTNFLLVAGCGASGNLMKTQAVLVKGADGTFLSPALDLNAGHAGLDIEHGNVAFDGTNYLVIYSSGVGGQRDVFGRFVSSGGALVGSPFAIGSAAGHEREPNLAFGGGKYLVAWHDDTRLGGNIDADVMAQFVLPNGSLDGSSFRIDTGNVDSRNPVTVGHNGTEFFVTYPENVSFAAGGQLDLYGALVTSTGGVRARFPIDSGANFRLMIGAPQWEGDRWRLTWSDSLGHADPLLISASTNVIRTVTADANGNAQGSPQTLASAVSGKAPGLAFARASDGATLAVIDRQAFGFGFDNAHDNDVYGLLVSSGWSAPAVPVSSVSLAFSGSFSGGAAAVAANGSGGGDIGHHVVLAQVGGSTFVYVTVHSTNHLTAGTAPDQTTLVKYDLGGVFIASATLLGNLSGDVLVSEQNQLYVSEKDNQGLRRLVRFDADLNRLNSVTVDAGTVGNITRGFGRNGFVYTVNDGGSVSNAAKVIKYDLGLNEVRRATFSFGSAHANANNVVVTPNGEVFVQVFSSNTLKLVKYDGNLNPLAERDISSLYPANGETFGLAFANGVLLGASFNGLGDALLIRKFDPALNYSGASTTMTVLSGAGFGLQAGPDGLFYVAVTSPSGNGGDFALKVLDSDLVERLTLGFDGGFASADSAIGLAVLNSSFVYVTGMAANSPSAEAVTFVRNLSAAGGGTGGGPGQEGGFWGLADKASKIWAVHRGLGVVRRYDFPAPPVSRNTAPQQELGPGNGAERPKALAVDGGGNLWVSVSTGPGAAANTRLVRYAEQGGPGEVATATSGLLSGLLSNAVALAYQPLVGDLWVAQGSNNPSIVRFTRGGTLGSPTYSDSGASTFTTNGQLSEANALAFDSANNLWVTSPLLGKVLRYENLGGGIISQSTSALFVSVPTPGAIAFSGSNGDMFVGETGGTTPFSGNLWKFVNQGTLASPFFSDSPVLVQTGVDPKALAFIGGQLWGTSDLNDQLITHQTEPPAPPPSFGTIAGVLSYGGAQSGQLYIAFSTDPVDIESSHAATLVVTTAALGGYSVATLQAPNTYYVSALRDSNGDGPNDNDPFGRYSSSFWGPRTPVYVQPEQTVTGVNVHIVDLIRATGTVANTSSQSGTLRVEPWFGTPGAAPENRISHGAFLTAGPSVPYGVEVATITNLHLRAYIDSNFNGKHDSGEDFGVVGPLDLSGLTPPATNFVANISIGSSPAGQLAFSAASLVGPNVATNGEEAFLRLALWAQGGNVQLGGLRVALEGDGSAPNAFVKVFKDANGDGNFQPGLDFVVGDRFFEGNPPRANVNFFSTQTVTASTANFFVALSLNNMPAGKFVGVSLEGSSAFTFGSGSLAAGQGSFPVESDLAVTQFALAARPVDQGYPNPQGGANPSGGFDTGLFVNSGQRLLINAAGSWGTGDFPASGPTGVAGQTSGAAPAPSVNLGSLIARIGGSAWFLVGNGVDLVASQSGPLALGMNDTLYGDNLGSILVDFQIVASTVTRTWLGNSGFGQGADIAQNWSGGQVPQSGESVQFIGANSADCVWNLPYASVGRFQMKDGYAGRVRLAGLNAPDDFNQLFVASHVLVHSGTLELGRNHTVFADGGVEVHGTLDMGSDNSGLGAGHGVVVAQGGLFRFAGTGFPRVFPTAFDALAFEVADGTIDVRGAGTGSGLRFERPDGVILSSSADILAFNGVAFDQYDTQNPSVSALDIARSTAGVYVFKGLEFNGNFTKNVDADGAVAGNSITMLDSLGPKRGSTFEQDLNNVVHWVPDGGGAPASISGTVIDGGVTISGSTVVVRASTQAFFDTNAFGPGGAGAGSSELVFITTRNSFGAYTLSGLQAPATYYLYAHRESVPLNPNTVPDGGEPRGAFGRPGLMRSDPVFVGSGQSVVSKDITLTQWAESSGTVSNNSQQFGTVLYAAAHVNSTNTFEAISYPVFGDQLPFLAAPATSLIYVGWVDVNNNRQKDAFEASGVFGPAVPPISTVTISIGGGEAPPGGTVSLAPTIPHSGLVGDLPPQAMMKLVLTGSGAQSRMNGVRVDIGGGPAQSYSLSAWVDNNGNGALDQQCGGGACDFSIGNAFITPPVSSAVVNFFQPLDLNAGAPRTLFVAFEPYSLTGGHQKLPPLSLTVAASNYFLMGAGAMDADPAYPIVSAANIGWSVMAQTQGDSFGGGGYYTGVTVHAGQTVTVTATGTWRFSGTPTDHRGIAGTESQPTLARGSRVGAILASVGNGWVAVGTGVTLSAQYTFGVHLSANDVPGDYFNNEGFATANIAVTGSTTSHVQGLVSYEGGLGGNLLVNLTQDCQFAPPGCDPIVSTQTIALVGGTTEYAYGLHIPFGGFFSVRGAVASNPSHRSGFVPSFEAPLGSTYTLNFPVSSGLGAITSTIVYNGVLNFGQFQVGVTTSTDLERGAHFFGGFSGPNAGPFTAGDLPIPNTYYMVAFRDGNFNREPDGPEPFGAIASVPSSQLVLSQLASVLTPIYVSSTAVVAPIVLEDRGGLSGRLFFQQAVASGQVVIAAAHGLPGSPEFVFENRSFRFVENVPAGGSVDYFLGLLKPAADYTLFAFLDQNFNEDHDAGEPFAQSAGGFITVPSGGFANRDLTVGAPAVPPAVTGFFVSTFTTNLLGLKWDATPGATEYRLVDASSATVAVLGGAATFYLEATVPAATSAVTGIRALNAIGAGPIVRLPASVSFAALATPVPAPVLTDVAVSSLTVTWTANGNGSLAKYQLERGSAATGPFQIIAYGTALSRGEGGLAPGTQYFYRVKAQSPNGAFSDPSPTASATTGASSDSNVNGLVQYLGKQAGPVVVQLFTASNPLSGLAGSVTLPPSAEQPYYIPASAASYFRRAFIDVDGNGLREPGEDQNAVTSVPASAGSPPSNFSIEVDTVTPGSPAGLRATTPFGRVDLTWNDTTVNANGTSLNDRAGYKVQRTTAGTLNFVTLSTGTYFGVPNLAANNFFADTSPVCLNGVENVYRVVTVDWGRNESIPSGAIAVRPACGGTISGSVSSFTATTSGAFRVRLSTSPRREDPFVSESTLQSFSFTGLSDGVYHLRAFRDTNADNQQDAATEPSGTHGGIVAPFPITIVNGNTVSGRGVLVCDRTQLELGRDATGFLQTTDCPAADKGQGFYTDLYTFRVGGGAAKSIAQNSSVDISLVTPGFDGELIVLGPDGRVVARDNAQGNPHVTFTAAQAGLYVVEPTSFFAGQTGFYDLLMNVYGGFSGAISGETTYSGSKTGPVRLQLFDRPEQDAYPFFVQDQPAGPGSFTLSNLSDGTFYLRAFRDVNANFAKDPGEPSGAYGVSESSPTAINVVGGVPNVTFAAVALADPSTGRIEGQIARVGSLPGTIRVEVGPRACSDCSDLNVVAFTTMSAAGPYVLDFIAPATNYIVQSFVDFNGNNRADSLEAKGSSSPITVAANSTSTVNVVVRDPGTGTSGSAVIFGTVSYSGASTGTMFVAFASDQNFNYIPYYLTNSATGYFSRSGLQGGTTYFVGAFIDTNGNGSIDEGGALVEPSGMYNGQLFVPNSSSVGVAFAISDPANGLVTGTVTYNGAISGPLVVTAQREVAGGGSSGEGGYRAVSIARTGASSYTYSAGFLAAGPFRMYAFIDSNGNQRSDFGEPFFRRESLVNVSSGTGGAPVTGINLLVLDAGAGGGGGAIGTISGSFGYSGGQPGPVVVQLFSTSTFVGIPQRTVNGSGGPSSFSFTFDNLSPGTYYIRAFKDGNVNNVFEEQYEANGKLAGGSGIAVSNDNPFSGGHVGTLVDPGFGGGATGNSIAGEMQYRGAFTTGTFHLAVFNDFGDLVSRATFPFAGQFNFTLTNLPSGQLFLRSFLDRNDNFGPDISEPFGVTDAQGISVFGPVSGLIASVCDRTPLDLTPGALNAFTLNGGSCFSRESETLGASNKLLTFRGARGQTFDAAATSDEDNYLYLYDQNGRLVAQADDGGAKTGDARLVATLPSSGDFTLSAGFYSAGVGGAMRVTLQNSGGTPGSIAGEVRYTGSQGGRVVTGLFNSADFDAEGAFVDSRDLPGPGAFSFAGLASETTYFLGAFVDVNFNRQPDLGEDFGVFSTAPPVAFGVFLRSGQDLGGLLLEIAASTAAFAGNEGQVTGVISYSGSLSGSLRVEFWADASFFGAPLAVRSIPTGVGPYDLSVPGGQPYVVRAFLDVNGDFVPSPDEPQGIYAPNGQGAEPVFVPSNGQVGGVDFTLRDAGIKFGQTEPSGEGTLSAAPATLSAGGSVDKVTFTYVAAGRGVREGGLVVVGVPFGFPVPQNGAPAGPGYVAAPVVTNPGGVAPTLALSFPAGQPALEFKVVNATPLYSGATVQFTYANVAVPCFAFDLRFFAGSASTGTVPPAPLFSGAPAVALGAGQASTVRSAETSIGLLQNTTSQRLLLEAADNCGNRVAVGADANVILRAKRYDYTTGGFEDTAGLRLSSVTTGVFDSTSVVTFLAGRSTASYRAVGLAGGDYFVEMASNLLAPGSTSYAALTVFANNSLSDVSVATVPFLLGRTSATITPNGDPSSANQAFINFTLGDPTRFWTVSVASTPFKLEQTPEPVAFFSGNGQPARGQIAWDGRDFRGARVPRGVYYVRVDVGGLRDDSLRITVQASELKMKVFDAGVTPNLPLSGVSIESFGTLGGGAEFLTDSNGGLTMAGLGAGEYRLRFQKDGYLPGRATVALSSFSTVSSMTATDSNVSLSSNAAGLLSVLMGRAPSLVVVPSITAASTQPFTLWGSLQVENTTAAFITNGPMRLPEGTTTFDDGGQWDPSLLQNLTKTILRFNLASATYTVRASLPGFDQIAQNVFVGASGQTTLTLPAFTKRSAFTGQVFLPAGYNTQGAFVSVSAVPITTTTALDGGSNGVFVPAAVDTATYRVDGLRPGSYRLTANTQGLKSVVIASATVVAGANTAVDFSSFPAANTSVIVATIGVTGISVSTFPGLPPALRLNISAWAPNSPNGFYQTVDVSTIGVSSQTVVVSMTGLDEGVQYQVFAGIQGNGDDSGTPEFDVSGGFPKFVTVSTTTGRGELAFDFAAASGVIRGVIYLPDTFGDFVNVDLYGETIASARPDQVGKTFTENALNLPGFAVGAAVNAASFTVTGVNTETTDITLTYRTTGRTIRTRLSVVNGQTTSFLADLRDPTFKVSGQIANQVTDPLFNTNQLIVVNAGSVPVRDAAGSKVLIATATVDLGSVGSVDSLARVLAIRQQFGVAASTSFNPATDRVGYLTTAGTYTIRNLSPGVYLLRTADIRTCATCQVVIPRRVQTVSVVDADVTASSFTLSDGFSVTGLIQLAGSVQDSGAFRLSLRNRRLEVVRSTGVTLGNAAAGVAAGSVAYRLDGVPAGEFYTLAVEDAAAQPRYIGKPLSFPDAGQSPNGLAGSITGQDVSLRRAAYLTGNLKDAASGEVFTERNAKILPPNLRITAVANPWVEGGFAQAASSVSNRPIRADGTFLVGPLFPEVSYDLKVFQDKWDLAFLAQGSQNYAPTGVAGQTMTALELRNVGTLALNQGTSIKGTLVDAASTTTALGNIRVAAKPSFGSVELNVETYSNALGQFTLWVSTFVSPQFDVTVAPRDGNLAANGKRYKTVDLPRFTVSASSINIQLTELASAVTGQIFTADGGALSYPFDDKQGFPAAAVFLQPVGVNPLQNPLGDIGVETDPDGRFTVPALSSGAYVVRAVALGYGVASGTVTVTSASFCISTAAVTGSCQAGLTLRRGGVVKGRISLPDGSSPSIDEIGGVAAADANFTKFVIGTVDSDQTARTVSGYSITGFEPGVAYNIVLLPPSRDDADVILPAEGQGVTFTASESTTTKTINLTYTRIVPDCEASAVESALGNNQFQVKISCTEPLRRQTSADDDVDRVLSVSSCVVNGSVKTDTANDCGSILGGASKKIESDRKSITAIYRAGGDNEEGFTLKLDALVATVDPATGENFRVSKLFTFDTLFRAEGTGEESRVVVSNTEEQISNHRGGAMGLLNSERNLNGEQFLMNFGAGSFGGCGPGDTDPNCQSQQGDNTKVKVVVKGSLGASDAANRAQATLGYVPSRIQALRARAGAFGPLAASSSTKNSFGKSPLSTFYDIFLPLGIRSQLTKAVDLTLPYDLSLAPATSISDLQIWSKSQGNIGKAGCTGQLCPEKGNQRVDTINRTITVSVDHFSQFVVLNGPPALSGNATFIEQKPIAFNFPNPFDCRARTVTCNVAEGSCAGGNVTGVGTIIHYAAPGPVTSLEHRFRIYNVAGELVDEFTKVANGGTHHYDFWDCTNSSGRAVASGVYILEYTVNGQSVYHKMAVIKGSGL